MGQTSTIEWTDATWNPWRGCTKVSPGCASCYMFSGQMRWGRDPHLLTKASASTFNAPLKWPSGRLVFTCSWSDWFHEDADAWRDEAWDIIRRRPDLTFQILTKRAERILDHLPPDWGEGWPNVWLGVSVENPWFYWRLDWLALVPAAVRFLSAEPLLKPLRGLDRYLSMKWWCCTICGHAYPADEGCDCPIVSADGLRVGTGMLDWVIAGGESGGRPGHPPRPMNVEWVRSIRDQCEAADVAFFFKQWGGRLPGGEALLDGREWRQLPWPELTGVAI